MIPVEDMRWCRWCQDTKPAYHENCPGGPMAPSGCRHCCVPEAEHMRRWTQLAGWHQWTEPTQEQIKQRMRARRSTPDITPIGDTE